MEDTSQNTFAFNVLRNAQKGINGMGSKLNIELTKEGLIDLIKQHFGELYGTDVVTVNIDHNLKTKIKING